ncbi:ubiquinol-cytochrome C chaperone family protein [Roseomonas sp. BN140053]|uniref:ubiquinol-cytochrome C chaperone family protein n=1 Tax=Roseomonas sp. BN140053 TaxID=3391898 RepID=UPI0039E75CD0
MGLFGLLRRKPFERQGFELYTGCVAAARSPELFGGVGVPDTLTGRFEMIVLHASLLVRRLHTDPDPRGPVLAQAVFDAMFADMDVNLREMGVGDNTVGKRVKVLWEGFHGRARALEAALNAADGAGVEAALDRNVWGGQAPAGAPAALARHVRAAAAALATQGIDELAAGRAVWPESAPA